ncbi:MAG: RIP metalloprotease RseP [Candidatus Omnitrophota bacterium]
MLFAFLFAVILSVLIIVHEWGHFFAARRLGIRVERFSIGFGPKLFGIRRKETEYRLSLIPLGGYVKLGGETKEQPLTGARWEYLSRSVGERFAVVFAGPLLNYILAFVLFATVYLLGNPQLTTKIGKVMEGYPAREAGLLEGDRILLIRNEKVQYWEDVTRIVHQTPKGKNVQLTVKRNEKELSFVVRPRWIEHKNLFGESEQLALIGVGPSDEIISVRYPVHRAVALAAKQLGQITYLTLKAIAGMVTGRMPLRESLTGPIGIFVITEQAARLGLVYLLQIVALISASLAIFNILPIPVLDGGHLLFLALERLKGSPVSDRAQELLRQVGTVLLVGLMLFVFYNDFLRFDVFERISSWFRKL